LSNTGGEDSLYCGSEGFFCSRIGYIVTNKEFDSNGWRDLLFTLGSFVQEPLSIGQKEI
jgi:hypothetical protein